MLDDDNIIRVDSHLQVNSQVYGNTSARVASQKMSPFQP